MLTLHDDNDYDDDDDNDDDDHLDDGYDANDGVGVSGVGDDDDDKYMSVVPYQ